jgi:TolB-like protein
MNMVFAQSASQKKIHIAVLDFDAREGVGKGEAASLSDIFCSQLVQTGKYVVVDRNRIKAILNEQGFQQSEACSSVECIVEAGKILKVEKIFAGVIGKIGRLYTINIQLIDISTAQIQDNKNRQHDGDIEDLAMKIIPEIASEMTFNLTGEEVTIEQDISSTGYKRHEFFVGFGGGSGDNNSTFIDARDVQIKVKGLFTAAYFYNFGRYFAAGLRFSNYHNEYERFPTMPLTAGRFMTLEINSNVLSLEGRCIFIRSAFEPYASLFFAFHFGNMKGSGNGDDVLRKIDYDGPGGGLALGVKALIFDNFGLAVEGRAVSGKMGWHNENPQNGYRFIQDEYNAAYRALMLMLFAQF